jgi:type I restriction enzyme S subunit
MELKPGYKQTEAGIIPEEWEVQQLGSLSPFVTSGPRGWADHYVESGSAFIRMTNLSRASIYLDLTDLRSVNVAPEDPEALRTRLERGDLLISITADIGIVGYVDSRVPLPAYINQHIALVRIDRFLADAQFLAYLLASENPQKAFRGSTDRGAKAGMNLARVCEIRVALPSLAEQRAIATALGDADALLGGLERLIAKKRDLKQAAMQQLLSGQTRLPGFYGEWEVKTLGDLFAFSGGYAASRSQLSAEGHCYLHYGDIHRRSNTFIDVRTEYQDIPKLDMPLEKVSPDALLAHGDVVFVDASEDDEGASKHVVIVNKDDIPFISGLHTIVAKSKTRDLANDYRRYCFQTAAIRQQFLFYAVGTKVTGISKANIAKLTLSVPSVSEQTAIAAVLSDMDAELAVLEARRDKTGALKQAMMQELLTGRIRLL